VLLDTQRSALGTGPSGTVVSKERFEVPRIRLQIDREPTEVIDVANPAQGKLHSSSRICWEGSSTNLQIMSESGQRPGLIGAESR
jgi:hypothetical protein